jgi:hypothetical protein
VERCRLIVVRRGLLYVAFRLVGGCCQEEVHV